MNSFGLSPKNFKILENIAITPLANLGAEVWIFGSRARRDNQPYSDIDILFEIKKDLPVGFLATIRMELEDSNLPIKVDLVNRNDLAESYCAQIEKEKIKIR